jgi:hypothetical protein
VPAGAALSTDYLAPTRSRVRATILPDVWVHALDGGGTWRQQARAQVLVSPPTTSAQLVRCIRHLLRSDASADVLVRPEDLGELRSGLPDDLATRVRSW